MSNGNPTDTNQASEDELRGKIRCLLGYCEANNHPCTYESSRNASQELDEIMQLIRTEKLKLLDELDKSMPTAEQLTTKYGYHMPEKQYGYKLALHDIREVLTKLEAEL